MVIVFRKVYNHFTKIPSHCVNTNGGINGIKLFLWFCPSLTQEEAEILNGIACRECLPIDKYCMINFITLELPLIRK